MKFQIQTMMIKLFNQFLKFGAFDAGVFDIETGTLLPE